MTIQSKHEFYQTVDKSMMVDNKSNLVVLIEQERVK